jgi:hypothetical protein
MNVCLHTADVRCDNCQSVFDSERPTPGAVSTGHIGVHYYPPLFVESNREVAIAALRRVATSGGDEAALAAAHMLLQLDGIDLSGPDEEPDGED